MSHPSQTRAAQGLGASLGIYAKSSSAPPKVDPETGEILPAGKVYDPVAARLQRFALQSAARAILPKSRTAKCLRCRQAHRPDVEVWRTRETGTARFRNLQTCASVWACPVCASRISERRSCELRNCIEQHEAAAGQVLLLTLTNPHTARDDLGDMLKAQSRAMSRFNGLRVAQLLWAEIGCIGTVRAWEVTHGRQRSRNNGWHPHFHILIFCRSGLDLDDIRPRMYAIWANCCRLAGLPIPSQRHGITLEDGSRASEYVSKGLWGLDREMTKGHIKQARGRVLNGVDPSDSAPGGSDDFRAAVAGCGNEEEEPLGARGVNGETPFSLLRAFLMNKQDKQAAALFREFALTFHGRRQLVYSKGLKAHFDLVEKTDTEISAEVEESAVLLGSISLDQWRVICRLDVRGDVLELARHGWAPVQRFLDSLPPNPPGINDS